MSEKYQPRAYVVTEDAFLIIKEAAEKANVSEGAALNMIILSWTRQKLRDFREKRYVNVEMDAKKSVLRNVRELTDKLDDELKNIGY
jgi:hypothetical protein